MGKVSWVVVFVGVVLAPLAFAGPQRVEIDVSDLVSERPGPPIYPVGWRLLVSSEVVPGRIIVGEANLLCGLPDLDDRPQLTTGPGEAARRLPPAAGLVDEDAFLAALAETSGLAPIALGYEDGRLHVRDEDAPAVRAAVAALRATAPPVVQLDVRLDAVDDGGAVDSLFAASGPIAAGLPQVFADAEMTNVLTDYEVEIAQASLIANPVVQVQRVGASVLTRVQPLPYGDRAVVETVARIARHLPAERIDTGHPGIGALDRCATGYEEAAVSFLVENGKPVEHRWTGREGRTMRLTTTATWASGGRESVLWSRLLDGPVVGFRNERAGMLACYGDEARDTHTPALPAFLRRLAAADEEALAASRPLEVDVWLVPAGVPFEKGDDPPEGSEPVARVRASVLEGLPACFNGTSERLYIVDWDVEVAQSARIPDPIVQDVQDGHFLEARLVRRGEETRARLDLELLRLAGIDRVLTELDVAQASAGVQGSLRSSTNQGGTSTASGEVYDSPAMPQDTVALERPRLFTLRVASDIPLDAEGSGRLRRSARGLAGGAFDVVVVVRAPTP